MNTHELTCFPLLTILQRLFRHNTLLKVTSVLCIVTNINTLTTTTPQIFTKRQRNVKTQHTIHEPPLRNTTLYSIAMLQNCHRIANKTDYSLKMSSIANTLQITAEYLPNLNNVDKF